jgi:CheY-like chemotaxis protein
MNGRRPAVLVVDDEDGIRECLAILLEDRYDVLPAPSGAAALAVLERCPVAAVVLDVRMPDIDGIEVLRRLRSTHPSLPVVLLSAVDSARTAADAMKLGAIDYLMKPFSDTELLTILDGALGSPPAVADAADLILWHAGGDLGRRAVAAGLLGTIRGVRIAPHGVTIIDGRRALPAMFGQLRAAYSRIDAAFETFGTVTAKVAELLAPSYRSATVEELAAAIGRSPRHLARRFARETSKTLREYLARVRTEAAKCLLRETDDKLDVIAEAVGLYDTSHLVRLFHRFEALRPAAFRMQAGRRMSEPSCIVSDPYIASRRSGA